MILKKYRVILHGQRTQNKRKPSRIEFVPASGEQWMPISVDTFGWQYPRDVIDKN